jgi:hypothetical protein
MSRSTNTSRRPQERPSRAFCQSLAIPRALACWKEDRATPQAPWVGIAGLVGRLIQGLEIKTGGVTPPEHASLIDRNLEQPCTEHMALPQLIQI